MTLKTAKMSLKKSLKSTWNFFLETCTHHVRQQAISQAHVDPDLCPHMASLCHNELITRLTMDRAHQQAWSRLSLPGLVQGNVAPGTRFTNS